jgi:hypothetical protein
MEGNGRRSLRSTKLPAIKEISTPGRRSIALHLVGYT